jgi:1-acyl-sn-glycerol-3-phosphate acyltransferase
MVRTLASAFRTVILVPLFFLMTLVLAVYVTIVGLIRKDSPRIEGTIQWWSRRFVGIPPLDYMITGADKVELGRQYVFVSNHQSNFDIPLLFRSIRVPIRFLAKKELFKIPFVGMAMGVVGIVKIDRTAGMSAHEAINAGVADARERGFSLIVFPEGTRSRTGEMAAFKKGAFRIAIDNQLMLVPVVIAGTFEVSPPGQWLIRPGRAKVVVLDPIDTTGMTVKEDVDRLLTQTHQQMSAVYDELRSAARNEREHQS